eukprot:GHVQ01020432.1.p1 GENE.GHVQ01020432.1~~GHVQ01020432.1.p1  ORF type:complete len:740 (-),score=126.27 GHVQ01020432.1:1103-3322(-)
MHSPMRLSPSPLPPLSHSCITSIHLSSHNTPSSTPNTQPPPPLVTVSSFNTQRPSPVYYILKLYFIYYIIYYTCISLSSSLVTSFYSHHILSHLNTISYIQYIPSSSSSSSSSPQCTSRRSSSSSSPSLIISAVAVSPPNPFLADSAWPIAQHDNYAQASTPLAGPRATDKVDVLFSSEVAGALTVLYTEDNDVIWGSSFKNVFKVDRSHNELQLIDVEEKAYELRRNDTFRGIYSVLSQDGTFYVSSCNVVASYRDRVQGNSQSGIRPVGQFDFSGQAREDERILALSMSYDGFIVFLTNLGGVGVLTRQLNSLRDMKYVHDLSIPSHNIQVTNSMSIDEHGGIYVVSSRCLHRLWWDSSRHRLYALPPRIAKISVASHSPASKPSYNTGGRYNNHQLRVTRTSEGGGVDGGRRRMVGVRGEGDTFGYGCNVSERRERMCAVWSTAYDVEGEPIVGRPTKEGSGTTPSLLKDTENNKLYVMIADGMIRQKVLAIDSETGLTVASALVSFDDNSKRGEASYTEQSILVSGNRFLVTQNALTHSGVRLNALLDLINAEQRVAEMGLPEAVENNVHLLPVVLGDSPRGYQQFELRTSVSPPEIVETWHRSDVGCPSAIPTMSEHTQVMYCVGKSMRASGNYPMHGFTGGWTVDALDWNTGETVFKTDTGHNVLYNSLYAATQIGPDKEIIYGSIGGLVRLRAGEPSSSPSSRRGGMGLPMNIIDIGLDFVTARGGGGRRPT